MFSLACRGMARCLLDRTCCDELQLAKARTRLSTPEKSGGMARGVTASALEWHWLVWRSIEQRFPNGPPASCRRIPSTKSRN